MTREEIEAQIQKEMDEFLNSPYPHALPSWFLDNFESAIMEFPQNILPYRADLLLSLLSKKHLADLTYYEVSFVATVFCTVPPRLIAKNVKRFVELKSTYEAIFVKQEMLTNNKKRALQAKAMTMAENNRNRILPANAMQMPKR